MLIVGGGGAAGCYKCGQQRVQRKSMMYLPLDFVAAFELLLYNRVLILKLKRM